MRDRASYYGLMKESMRRLAKNKNTIVLSGEGMKRVWDRYEKALQTSETINRVAEYRGAFREAKKKEWTITTQGYMPPPVQET